MKKNVCDKIKEIINDKSIRVWDKERMLAEIDIDGKAGCVTAREEISKWRRSVGEKKRELKNRIAGQYEVRSRYNNCKTVQDYVGFKIIVCFYNSIGMSAECRCGGMSWLRNGGYEDLANRVNNVVRKLHSAWNQNDSIDVNRMRLGHTYNSVRLEWCQIKAELEDARRCVDEMQKNKEREAVLFYTKHGVQSKNVASIFCVDKDIENCCILGQYAFEVVEDVEKDWNYYYKSYGFPKVTVNERYINVYKNGKKVDKIVLDSFRGNYMVDAVAKYLGVEVPKVDKDLRKFQITKWTDVKRSVKKDGVQLYSLTLGKYIVGYVAYDKENDVHYHADTREEAVAKLKEKVQKTKEATEVERTTKLTAKELHRRFGFCWPGMTEFAEACGIDRDADYTVAQLKEAVKNVTDRSVLVKYKRELRLIKVLG